MFYQTHGKEFDTYKVGTTANSCSTMHKLASYPIDLKSFEITDYHPHLPIIGEEIGGIDTDHYVESLIYFLESLRQKYVETKDKRYWKELVRWLPEGWLQKRTITMNYENLRSMFNQRNGHKLVEWHSFCDWIKTLPYAEDLILYKSLPE